MERGDLTLAREALNEAAAIEPEQAGLQELLDIVTQRGKAKTPLDSWSPPVRVTANGSEAEGIHARARSWAATARRAFEEFVKLAPDSWQANLFLGDLARQRRAFGEALRRYQIAADKMPDALGAWLGLGTAYWETGDDANAVRYLEEARKRSRTHVQVLYPLGHIAVKQGRDSDAVALLGECLRLAPDHLGAHAEIGKAYGHLRRWAEAARHLERARGIDTYGDIHFQLFKSLDALGRKSEAGQALEESKRIRAAQHERERRLKLLD